MSLERKVKISLLANLNNEFAFLMEKKNPFTFKISVARKIFNAVFKLRRYFKTKQQKLIISNY